MDIKEFILAMWPYWLLGLAMIAATWKSDYKDLLRIDFRAVLFWISFISFLTAFRVFAFKHSVNPIQSNPQEIAVFPWQLTLTVFWEDMAHTLPLAILRRMIGTKWFTMPIHYIALITMMVAFGAGHLYQGVLVAALIMFYIPYTLKKGEQYGFGTIALCHMIYDLSTILFVKWSLVQ